MPHSIDVRDAFQRCLALVFFLAFCSFYGQKPELVGDKGVEPFQTIIEQRRVPGDLLESFSGTPTLLWLLDLLKVGPAAGADLLAVVGGILSAAAAFLSPRLFGGCTPLLVALALLYLSLVAPLATATARGSATPWAEVAADGLLLEAAFAAALWAPLWPKSDDEEIEIQEDGGGGGGGGGEGSNGDGTSSSSSSSSSPIDPSAPALAPAFLLRWVAAKNALYRGLARWRRRKQHGRASSSPRLRLLLVAADVAVAPLALSPSRLPRVVAAAALLFSWLADVLASFSSSSSSSLSLSSAWGSLLRLALVVPLLHAGVLDDERANKNNNEATTSSSTTTTTTTTTRKSAARAARAAVSALSLVPALFSSLAIVSSSTSSSSPPPPLEASLAKFAPWCLAAAGMTMAASLAADVLRSMSSASIGEDEEGGGEGGESSREEAEKERPRTLSQRLREEEEEEKKKKRKKQQKRQRPQYVRGAHEPALVGAISLMLFCAGCFELWGVVSVPPSASIANGGGGGGGGGGGCSGSDGCGSGPAALVAARRLSWLARPWRATGPSFQAVLREEQEEEEEEEGIQSGKKITIEVKGGSCVDDDEEEEDEEKDEKEGRWVPLSPRSPSSRVALALSTSFPEASPRDNAESFPAPPPWLDHLLYRLVSDPEGPVAASFSAATAVEESRRRRRRPCAARAVVFVPRASDDGDNGKKTKTRKRRTWASVSAREALDASSAASERLARHGWGPLVQYDEPSRLGGLVAALARPPPFASAFAGGGGGGGGVGGGNGGSGVSAFVVLASAVAASAAVALAGSRRRRPVTAAPGATAAAAATSKKRD